MNFGRERSDVPYIWPATLVTPVRPPAVVYLDLNHWIELSKALAGHPTGSEYRSTLNDCIHAVDGGQAIFPICASTYMEIFRIQSCKQRRNIRAVIEEIGKFRSIVSLPRQVMHEVESSLDNFIGKSSITCSNDQYIGWGFEHSFGMNTEQTIANYFRMKLRNEAGNFDEDSISRLIEWNREVIDGLPPKEKEDSQNDGLDPIEGLRPIDNNANVECEQQRVLSRHPEWRRGRLRDVVAARELCYRFNDIFSRSLLARKVFTLESAFPHVNDIRRVVDAMPTLDVLVSLKTEYHRNPQHRWKRNDIHDIYAMASSIPYCDIVVSDKSIFSQAKKSGLLKRLNTKMFTKVSRIFDFL